MRSNVRIRLGDELEQMLPPQFRDVAGSLTYVSQDERLQRLEGWNLDKVRALLRRDTGISETEALERERKYRNFMRGVVLSGGKYVVTKEMTDEDSFFHCHILTTKDYELFCESVHGKMIHHYPNLDKPKYGQCKDCEGAACGSSEEN